MARCKPGSRSGCPVAYALDVLGDQWTLLIVRDLLLSSKRRYREFLESPEGIATNVLADRLERLESVGIVVSVPDPADGRRSLYYLTDKGLDLFPAMLELIGWSARYDPATLATPEKMRSIRQSRDALVARHRSERELSLTGARSAGDTPPPPGTSGRSAGGRAGRARR